MRSSRSRVQPYLIEEQAITLEELRRLRGSLTTPEPAPDALTSHRL